jgi:hypothetical protein
VPVGLAALVVLLVTVVAMTETKTAPPRGGEEAVVPSATEGLRHWKK